ncbi:MAG: hypothetical protein KJ069_11095 [Anaerolineae bacterium]|nr:hypothetical protein [Anaerolineae bacterium]
MDDKTAVATYRTVILRCWSEQDEVESRRFWRFHLQWLDTQERQSFADIEMLLAALAHIFNGENQ